MKCFKLGLSWTVQAIHEGIYKVPWLLEVAWLLEVVTIMWNVTHLLLPGRHTNATTRVIFSQQVNSFILGYVFTFSVLQKCSSLAYVSIWPCQTDSTDTSRIINPIWICLFHRCAMTSIFQSAQTLVIKLWDLIIICQLWSRCLLEQETLRLI